MFLGYIRDRTALIFTILIPVLFLVLLGSIYRGPAAPKITVLEIGQVSMLDQARAASPGQLGKVMTVTRTSNLARALAPGLLGWAIASGAAFGAAITLVGWRKDKLLRRLRLAPVSTSSVVTARIGMSRSPSCRCSRSSR